MSHLVKALLIGFFASLSLLIFYFLLMLFGKNSFIAAYEQLTTLRFWVFPLITTFGIEVGLFAYIKSMHKVSGKTTIVSSASSGVAMVACCAHHITDILPLVGFSVLATLLTAYQPWFFAFGIISNLFAIVLLLRKLSWSNEEKRQLKLIGFLLSPLVIIGVGYILITKNISFTKNVAQGTIVYQTQENDEKEVAVIVTPTMLLSSQNVVFDIAMNNHQYELSSDLVKIAILTDDKGNLYKPRSWNGTTGGHHILGKLIFPPLTRGATFVTLNLPKIVGVDRTFTWKL